MVAARCAGAQPGRAAADHWLDGLGRGGGPNWLATWRRAAGKILRGAKLGDIPVEQPTQCILVLSVTTAKALEGSSGREKRRRAPPSLSAC